MHLWLIRAAPMPSLSYCQIIWTNLTSLCSLCSNVPGVSANASLALLSARHALLLALTDQCVSRGAQVTQLPASAPSSHPHNHREHTNVDLGDHKPEEPIDAASMTRREQATASATRDGGALGSVTGSANANASSLLFGGG